MKRNFNFELTYKCGKHKIYNAEEIIKEEYNKYKLKGIIRIRPSGKPNTAYAEFWKICLDYSNIEFGFYLTKHFDNKNAWMSAKRWLNWMLNNYPSYCGNYKNKLRGKNG